MELKPIKRMKTRKELNALRPSNGTVSTKSFNRRNGEHNIVNMDSQSSLSDVDSTVPFVFHQQHKVNAKTSCFTYLLYVNAFFTFCTIIFCAILTWFYFTLKTETNTISGIITSVDLSRKNFDLQFQNVHTNVHNAHVQLTTLTHNVSILNNYFKMLSEKVDHIDQSLGNTIDNSGITTDLHSLPSKFEQLQQTVASLGSTVKQLQFDMSGSYAIKNEQLIGRISAVERNFSFLYNNTMHLSLIITDGKTGVIDRLEALEKRSGLTQTNNNVTSSLRRNRRSLTLNQRVNFLESIVEQVQINERLKCLELSMDNFQTTIEKTFGCDLRNISTNLVRACFPKVKIPHCMLWINSLRDATSGFQLWDRNRDGKLDSFEMDQLHDRWSRSVPFRQYLLRRFDANKDGRLNESEVLCFLGYGAPDSCQQP